MYCENEMLSKSTAHNIRRDSNNTIFGGECTFLKHVLNVLIVCPKSVEAIIPYFQTKVVDEGFVLWSKNDDSSFLCIVEEGLLGVSNSCKLLNFFLRGSNMNAVQPF